MDNGGVLAELFDEVGTVVDEQSAGLTHPHVIVFQQIQQFRLFRPIFQNPGFLIVQPLILRQSFRVAGPELADDAVQKIPPGGGAGADEIQILRTEQDGIQDTGQFSGTLQPHPVLFQSPPLPPPEPRFQEKVPVPAGELTQDLRLRLVEGDQLSIPPSPMAPAGGQVGDGLDEVGLALGVVAVDDIDGGREIHIQ